MKLRKFMIASAVAVASLGAMTGSSDAAGSWHSISGSTSATNCSWYTSSNLRFVSQGGTSSIKVNMSDVGPLGMKFRVRFENTGLTSVTAYVPPINTQQWLAGSQSGSTPFRAQFACQTTKSFWQQTPQTSFAGSLLY